MSNAETDTKKEATPPKATEPKVEDSAEADKAEPAPTADSLNMDSLSMKPSGQEPIDDSEVEVKVEQSDPDNPLVSVHTFEEIDPPLKPELLRGVSEAGYKRPSKIQEKALPMIFANPPRNMIAQSQSGTGKTAAFALGMLQRVDESQHTVQALCLCPTRELARQNHAVILALGRFMNVTSRLALAGERLKPGEKIKEQIVVGTPGKMEEWIKKRCIDTRTVKVFVMDEADEMVDERKNQGFGELCRKIRSKLSKDVQILLFSATWNKEVRGFALKLVTNPNLITLAARKQARSEILQYYMSCTSAEDKFQTLQDIYSTMTLGQTVIFVEKRATALDLDKRMREAGFQTSVIIGSSNRDEFSTEDRDKAIDAFRSGDTKVLIATNVIAKGIDIPQVHMVVNYELPLERDGSAINKEIYLHRIGRTGRWDRKGIALNLVSTPKEKELLHDVGEHFGKHIEQVPDNDVEELEKLIPQ